MRRQQQINWEVETLLINIYIYIIIITIIMSCHQHGYPWPSLATSPYHSSLPAGLQGYILCLHIDAVCKFKLVDKWVYFSLSEKFFFQAIKKIVCIKRYLKSKLSLSLSLSLTHTQPHTHTHTHTGVHYGAEVISLEILNLVKWFLILLQTAITFVLML